MGNIKRKSISAEDLKTLLKKMVNGALTDTEQMAKLHHIICEEWYGNDFHEMRSLKQDTLESKEILREEAGDNLGISVTSVMPEVQDSSKTSKSSVVVYNSYSEDNVAITVEEIKEQEIEETDKTETAAEIKKSPSQRQEINDSSQARKKLSFDEWKEKKNATYKEVLKNRKMEQEYMQCAMKVEHERKRRAQEEQEYMKLLCLERQRMYNTYVEGLKREQMKNQENETHMRRLLNEQAYEAWKKRKDAKMKEQRRFMFMMNDYQGHFEGNRKMPNPMLENATAQFTSWLNQLNWVLHEKYVRERRHLVRSIYCQPTYYGAR